MDRQAMQYSYFPVIAHVLEEHNDEIDALTEKYNVPFEEFAAVMAPLTRHLYQHAYEMGTNDEPYTEEQIAEMQAEGEGEKQENPLNQYAATLDGEGNTLIDDSLCQLLGTC